MSKENYIDYRSELEVYYSGQLPHWDIDDGVYFVTWRLADSLPPTRVESLQFEYQRGLHETAGVRDHEERALLRDEFRNEFFRTQFDSALDEGHGTMWLMRPEFADVVKDAILYFDGVRYLVVAWVVMGNHVHVLFIRHPDHPLGRVLHSWKSYTAHQLKPKTDLGPKEPFWQENYWDRLVRTFEELDHAIEYILRNPVQAGMRDWDYVGYHPESLRTEWPPRRQAV